MIKLSAIIIAKDAEEYIADCLDSVSFCDEIIVIDDDSKDRTIELSRHLGAKTVSFSSDSFAEKRNFAITKTKGKWILYVDADERVSSQLKDAIQKALKENTEFSAYRIQRKNFYFGKHEWPYIEKLERLFKKSSLEGWHGAVHETPVVKGEIGELEGFVIHYTHKDLTSMLEKTIAWSEIEAELRLKSNHPKMSWWRFFRVMVTAFSEFYVRQKGYKAGTAGLVESIYQSFSMFITYARLWEKQNTSKR